MRFWLTSHDTVHFSNFVSQSLSSLPFFGQEVLSDSIFKSTATTAKCFHSAKANRLTALNDTLPKNNCILHYHSFHTVMKTDSQTYRQTQRETDIDQKKRLMGRLTKQKRSLPSLQHTNSNTQVEAKIDGQTDNKRESGREQLKNK